MILMERQSEARQALSPMSTRSDLHASIGLESIRARLPRIAGRLW